MVQAKEQSTLERDYKSNPLMQGILCHIAAWKCQIGFPKSVGGPCFSITLLHFFLNAKVQVYYITHVTVLSSSTKTPTAAQDEPPFTNLQLVERVDGCGFSPTAAARPLSWCSKRILTHFVVSSWPYFTAGPDTSCQHMQAYHYFLIGDYAKPFGYIHNDFVAQVS